MVLRNYITLGQASGLSGVTVDTLRQYVRTGQIEAFKVGATWRIYLDEWYRYQAEGLRQIPEQSE